MWTEEQRKLIDTFRNSANVSKNSTLCIYSELDVFCTDLRTSSDYFPILY
jgi:hypothetical protein